MKHYIKFNKITFPVLQFTEEFAVVYDYSGNIISLPLRECTIYFPNINERHLLERVSSNQKGKD